MADVDKFKRARQNQNFVEDTNSDVSKKKIKTVLTRSNHEIQFEENTLSTRQRSRTKHGRNITVPLFQEELHALETAVAILSETKELSISAFIREALLKECKKVMGKDSYESIICTKLNVKKTTKIDV